MARFTDSCSRCGKLRIRASFKDIHKTKKRTTDKPTICSYCRRVNRSEMQKRLTEMISAGSSRSEISNSGICGSPGTVTKYLKLAGRQIRSPKKLEKISDSSGKCRACREIFQLSAFKSKTGFISVCCHCRAADRANRLNEDIYLYFKSRCRGVASNAKKSGIYFDLTPDCLLEAFNLQNGRCFYMDIPMKPLSGAGRLPDLVTVDRIEPELGYTKSNIVLCTWRANAIKNNLTLVEMAEIIPSWYLKIKVKMVENGKDIN